MSAQMCHGGRGSTSPRHQGRLITCPASPFDSRKDGTGGLPQGRLTVSASAGRYHSAGSPGASPGDTAIGERREASPNNA